MNNRRKPQPTNPLTLFYRRSIVFLAQTLRGTQGTVRSTEPKYPITVVCISDTHTTQPDLPEGDLLLHAGDLSQSGSFSEIQTQLDWLNAQTHRYKVVIGGNHDLLLDPTFVDRFPERIFERPGSSRADLRWGDVIYLQDRSIQLHFKNGRSLNIYGSPWTSQYGNWAFQYPPIRDVWTGVVPRDTDILLTHGPPKWHLDASSLGSEYLLKELRSVKPLMIVFGHIHAGYGQELIAFDPVQAAYEDVVLGSKGFVTLFKMVIHLSIQMFAMLLAWSPPMPKVTRLVNASVVGGRQNEQRRMPIRVNI